MRTSQVAERAGVNVQTLRYYQRRGLLASPPRTETGYRQWGSDAVSTMAHGDTLALQSDQTAVGDLIVT
jgi:DNA-binding transcriptional MerR regulator